MVVSQNNKCPQINIYNNRNELKQRDQLKYQFANVLIAENKEDLQQLLDDVE